MNLERLQNLLIARAGNKHASENRYQAIRDQLLSESSGKELLPQFVIESPNLGKFWRFISLEAQVIGDEVLQGSSRASGSSSSPDRSLLTGNERRLSTPNVSSILSISVGRNGAVRRGRD